MRVGIVADDLTGAMDASAPFADRGFATRVLLSHGAARDGADACEVLAIDTHSRDLDADGAATAVQSAFARMGTDRLPFKKIDSTLRGNVGAELAAAMQASGRNCALVAPAAPAQGRTLRGGHLFVHGQRVGELSLPQALHRVLRGVSVRQLRAGETPGEERCVLVADAESGQDLARIADLGLAAGDKVLLVGSSGLAAALADRMRSAGLQPQHQPLPQYDRLIFVVGSHNACSAGQVRALLAERRVETVTLTARGELRKAQAGASPGALVIHVEGLDAPPTLDAPWVVRRLADATAEALAVRADARTALFMTGGDTARAVLSRLQVGEVDVIGSLYPGVVHGRVTAQGRRLGIVTKAGGFGSPDLFARVLASITTVPGPRSSCGPDASGNAWR
jgi:uncharacterized protein YgbK (DUF1537 family)